MTPNPDFKVTPLFDTEYPKATNRLAASESGKNGLFFPKF